MIIQLNLVMSSVSLKCEENRNNSTDTWRELSVFKFLNLAFYCSGIKKGRSLATCLIDSLHVQHLLFF